MQTNREDGQVSLFAHDGCAGKMCPARLAAGRQKGRTSESSSRRSSGSKAIPFMSLDLTPGHGNLLGESYWEMISPSLGGSSILNTGPAPLREEDVYSLSQILQANPPRKYYLSRTACLGILQGCMKICNFLPISPYICISKLEVSYVTRTNRGLRRDRWQRRILSKS